MLVELAPVDQSRRVSHGAMDSIMMQARREDAGGAEAGCAAEMHGERWTRGWSGNSVGTVASR